MALHSKVNVPGIGTFYKHRQPAYLDFTKKAFIAPSTQIAFTTSDEIDDSKFYSFLAREQRIEEPVALQRFNDFTKTLQENLRSGGKVELTGFGWLSAAHSGTLHFEPVELLPFFFTDVAAEKPLQAIPDESTVVAGKIEDDQMQLSVGQHANPTSNKEYWWIFAMLLAAAAIAAIIYYYNKNGSLR